MASGIGPIQNLFSDLPDAAGKEACEALLQTPGVRIERIVSQGQCSPDGFWYDQDQGEWILLLQGAARLTIEGRDPISLSPGSFLHIPAHQRHRVDWTDPAEKTIWLAIHYPAT